MYTNNMSKYNQDYANDFEERNVRNLGYPYSANLQDKNKLHQHSPDENYVDLEINSENFDSDKLKMGDRDSLGFDRKIKEREKELHKDSPLHEKESFRQIKNDHEHNKLNLNDKAQLYNADARKIQNGVPLKFLIVDNKGIISLSKDSTVELLKYNGKIGFVSIVGDPKTGKSFLMNNLMGLENSQFEIDSARNPKSAITTWLWSIPLYIAQEDKYIFFIDTQGLEKNDQRENRVGQKIFTIITLLSSCLLYNLTGDLTESTIKKLYMIATLPASISHNSSNLENENNEEKISKFFPKFMLLLRDVEKDTKELKIKDKLIKTTARENMENLLNDLTKTRNELTFKIKKALVGIFKERDCLLFPKPFKSSSQQHSYNTNQMTSEFYNCLMNLREKIEKDVEEKMIFHISLNSRMICSLLQSFIDIENQNGVIDLSLSWEHVVENEFIHFYNESVHQYHERMKNYLDQGKIPSAKEMTKVLRKLRDDVLETFDECIKLKNKLSEKKYQEYRRKLIELMDQKEEIALSLNGDEDCPENIDEQIIQMFDTLEENIKNENYDDNKIEEFIQDINIVFESGITAKDKSGQLSNLVSKFNNEGLKLLLYQLSSKGGVANHAEIIKKMEANINEHEQQKKKLHEELNEHKKNIANYEREITSLKKNNNELINPLKETKEVSHLKAVNKKLEDELKKTQHELGQLKMKKKKCCG